MRQLDYDGDIIMIASITCTKKRKSARYNTYVASGYIDATNERIAGFEVFCEHVSLIRAAGYLKDNELDSLEERQSYQFPQPVAVTTVTQGGRRRLESVLTILNIDGQMKSLWLGHKSENRVRVGDILVTPYDGTGSRIVALHNEGSVIFKATLQDGAVVRLRDRDMNFIGELS